MAGGSRYDERPSRVYLAAEKGDARRPPGSCSPRLVRQEVGQEPNRKTVSRAEGPQVGGSGARWTTSSNSSSRAGWWPIERRSVRLPGPRRLIEVWPQLNGWIADYHHRWAVHRAAADKWLESRVRPVPALGRRGSWWKRKGTRISTRSRASSSHSRRQEQRAVRTRRLLTLGEAISLLVLATIVQEVREAQQRAKLAEEKNRTDEADARRHWPWPRRRRAREALNLHVAHGDRRRPVPGRRGIEDSEDVSGAVLWYGEACAAFGSNLQFLPRRVRHSSEQPSTPARHRHALAPVVRRLVTSRSMAGAAFSTGDADGKPDQRWIATWVAPNASGVASCAWNLTDPGGASQALEAPPAWTRSRSVRQDRATGSSSCSPRVLAPHQVREHAKLFGTASALNRGSFWPSALTFTTGVEGPRPRPSPRGHPVLQVEFSGNGRRAVILLEGQQERSRVHLVLVWDGVGAGGGTFRNLPLPENAVVNRIALCPSAGDLVAATVQPKTPFGTHGEDACGPRDQTRSWLPTPTRPRSDTSGSAGWEVARDVRGADDAVTRKRRTLAGK